MTNSALTFLLFSIGPVQDFIAAARKTKDLFAGSLMLSYLSTKAIETILIEGNKNGRSVSMMFPDVSLNGGKLSTNYEDSSIPNRFLVDVTNYPFDKVHELAQSAKDKVLEEFNLILNYAKALLSASSDPVWDTFWKEQSKKFLECYWVVERSTDGDYGKRYKAIEQLSGKRKLLRNFEEFDYQLINANGKGQPGVKCTLISGLSAVHPASAKTDREVKEFWNNKAKKQPGEIRKSERLSAVAVGKRFFVEYLIAKGYVAKGRQRFPSTTTIAAGSFTKAIVEQYATDTDLQESIGEYARKVKSLVENLRFPHPIANLPLVEQKASGDTQLESFVGLDSDWLYEEIYKVEILDMEYGVTPDTTKLMEAKSARDRLFRSIKNVNTKGKSTKPVIPAVSKYYAILFFDGDNMGKWLSGGMENAISPEKHKELSANLRRFSTDIESVESGTDQPKNVYQIVEKEHLGKIVYSGGDDVVAFVVLEDCLDVALQIRQEFQKWMEAAGCKPPAKEPTGSLGMAIAHHQMNLQQVLQEARRAEHYAKEGLNRDAFAIALLKRSGEHSTTGSRWFLHSGEVSTIKVMDGFKQLVRERVISTRFVYDLENERIGLSVFEAPANHDETPILAEIRRLLYRHSKSDDQSKEAVAEFHEKSIIPLYRQLRKVNPLPMKQGTTEPYMPLEQLIDLLMVAQFIAQGGAR
jgi:CRISPR-associated protein Cmr2